MNNPKPKRQRRSRNAGIEERERRALEENLKIVGPDGREVKDFADIKPSKEFVQSLAELLADLIIEKAKAGKYGEAGLRAVGASEEEIRRFREARVTLGSDFTG